MIEISFAQTESAFEDYITRMNLLFAEQVRREDPGLVTPWIFRGVSNSAHSLQVSLKWARQNLAGTPTAPVPHSGEGEVEMFTQFKNWALDSGAVPPRFRMTELDWLCLARHHSLPCRVLDWSENPLVALYFGCFHMGSENEAAVYAVPRPPMATPSEVENPFDITIIKAYRPSPISPRVIGQNSLVTVHPMPLEEYRPDLGYKYLFPKEVQGEIKHYLHHYGIHHRSLFGDLDGVAHHLRWLYKWNVL